MNAPESTVAKFALTAPLTIAPSKLKKGELWAGVVTTPKGLHHVILLPGDQDPTTWKKQLAWAKKAGGDLPDRQELALLRVMLPDEFQKTWYWSCEQHAAYPDYAWYQYFHDGDQYDLHINVRLRARAVRRVAI
jgi:hypothetical protein